MTKYLKYFFAGLVLMGGATVAMSAVTSPIPTRTPFTYYLPQILLNATTTVNSTQQATSTNRTDGGGMAIITGAKKATMYFTHGGTATTSTATSTFSVQGTPDGTNWYNLVKLMQATSTTYQATATIEGATSTQIFTLDLTNAFYAIRCIATGGGQIGTQGEHTCSVSLEF